MKEYKFSVEKVISSIVLKNGIYCIGNTAELFPSDKEYKDQFKKMISMKNHYPKLNQSRQLLHSRTVK